MKNLTFLLVFMTLSLSEVCWGQTLSQQKMCDEQAHLRFQREFEGKFTDGSRYLSHFDPKANVCYVMLIGSGQVVGGYTPEGVTVVSLQVKDAFEGSLYGEFYSRICADCGDKPTECYVIPHGSDGRVRCDTASQFWGLVRKYFGVKG